MKKHLTVILLLSIAVVSCGKEQDNVDLSASKTIAEIIKETENFENTSNIDFTETKFIIPDVDTINDVKFYVESKGESSEATFNDVKEEFYDAIEDFTKNKPQEEYINLVLGNEDRTLFSINDVNEDVLKMSDLYQYLLSYNDGKKSLLLYANSFMCEMGGEEVSKQNTPTETWLGFRPQDELKVASYNICYDDYENVSYMMNGEDVSLKESIEFVEDEMKNNHPLFTTDSLDYKVYEVEVYQINEDNYYYKMHVKAIFNGVALQYDLMSELYSSKTNVDDEYNYVERHTVDVMKKDSIDYIWSCCHAYEQDEIELGESYNKFVSLKSAAKLISKDISSEQVLKCSKVELVYRPLELDNDLNYSFYDNDIGKEVSGKRSSMKGLSCHPMYIFEFTDTGLPDYPYIYYGVDATTGEMLTSGIDYEQ